MKTRKGVRHSPKTVTGRPRKIGVERGFGPRHGANAKEGDLTEVNTDTVPAMLTPREAVLNRNAAELAGRDKIEALNEEGNALAKKGVDLAGGEKEVAHLAGGESNLRPGWINDTYDLPSGNQPRVDQWLIDYMAKLRADQSAGDEPWNEPDPLPSPAPDPNVHINDPRAAPSGGFTVPSGPFSGWTPSQVDAWHSGAGPGTMGFPSFEGNTAGPGGTPLGYSTTSYNVPGYGWVPHAELANSMASNNFWDYLNPWGGTTRGGSGTGVPTQKAIGTITGTLTNVLVPGLGFVTGPIARWITSKIQGGMSHEEAVQAARDAGVTGTSEPPPMPSGSVDLPGGGGRGDKWHATFGQGSGGWGKPMGYFDIPNFMQHGDFGAPTTIAGNPSGQGTIANTGITLNDIVASGVTPRAVQSVGAPSGGYAPMGFSGPSNLNWNAGAWGDSGDRPHANPFFGGFSADKQAGGPGVKLRAKGDSDVKGETMKSKPKQSKSEKSGSPYVQGYERLMPKGYAAGGLVPAGSTTSIDPRYRNPLQPAGSTTSTDPAGGPPRFGEGQLNYMRRYGQLPPSMGGGALGQGQENLLNMVRGGGQIKPGELPQPAQYTPAGSTTSMDPAQLKPAVSVESTNPAVWNPGGEVSQPARWNPTQYDPQMRTLGGGGNWNPTAYDPQMHTIGGGTGGYSKGLGGYGGGGGVWRGGLGGGPSGGTSGQPAPYPGGTQPGPAPMPVASNSFYPNNQWFGGGARKAPGYAEGTGEVRGSSINDNFGPPPQLSAPDISALLKVLKEQGGKNGLNASQIQGLMSAFQGMGGGSGYANQSPSAGEDFGNPNYIGLGTPSYQGGISEVGYPPGIAPRADFSYEEGGWTGPLDPRWSSPGYRHGNSDIPFWR